jgi:hypothetical protein
MPQARINDADAINFLVSQLAYVEGKVWEAKYTEIMYDRLIPVSYEAGEWATSIEVHYRDGFTQGKFLGTAGDDIPFAQVNKGRDQIPVRYAGIGYEYTLEELRQSMRYDQPLDVQQAMQARRGYEEHCQNVALNGDTPRNLQGLLTHTGIATGAAASTFATALATSVDALLTVVNEPINAIINGTNQIEIPDRYLLPISQFNLLATTRLNTVSDQTVLEFLRLKNAATARTGKPMEFIAVPQLSNKSMVYKSDPSIMVLHVPMPLRFVAPQPVNLKVRVPGEYKIAGLEVRYTGACIYRTGI